MGLFGVDLPLEDVEEDLLVDALELVLDDVREQVVGHGHHGAEVSVRVSRQRALDVVGDEVGAAGLLEGLVEHGVEVIGFGITELQVRANAALDGQHVGCTQARREALVAGDDDGE